MDQEGNEDGYPCMNGPDRVTGVTDSQTVSMTVYERGFRPGNRSSAQ